MSGPDAGDALALLAGGLPVARYATLRPLRDPSDASLLDRALVLWMPGPATATGEDIAELHCHGGRAVVAAVLAALSRMAGLRPAEPGEFTRRAFENSRIDLAQAEALADLLCAETEAQRRSAIAGADGGISRMVEDWYRRLVDVAAVVEASIEYDEEDETITGVNVAPAIEALAGDIRMAIAKPPAERMRDGIRVVIAGPPNTGKSSLLNALAGRQVALVSDMPGTTRDVIEVPLALDGLPFVLCDTAGLRETADVVEGLGVALAHNRIETADIVLWLGEPEHAPPHALLITVASKADVLAQANDRADFLVSAVTGFQVPKLRDALISCGSSLLDRSGITLNARQWATARSALDLLEAASAGPSDVIIIADELRRALAQLDALLGRTNVEHVLDSVFDQFCIGK